MRTNPIKTRESEIREVIKATFVRFIPKVWYACYQLPKHLMGNYQAIQVPVKDDPKMLITLHRSRLEVMYNEELYIVDFALCGQTAQFSDFLVSSNWGNGSGSMFVFPKVITALTTHMADVAQRL